MAQHVDIIEAEGVSVDDDIGAIPAPAAEPLEREDVPAYTIAAAIDWTRKPENAQAIEQLSADLKRNFRTFVQAVDRDVSKTGSLLRSLLTDESELEKFKNAFTKSIWGIED